MLKIYLFLSFFMLTGVAHAQTPTWSTDVAPIIYNRCATCHHSGGIAPFSLMSYTDAVNNAAGMQTDVSTGKMPPWPPDPSYARLAHERVLSASEKQKILDWLTGGKPAGNLAFAPPQPAFPTGGDLPGTPSLTLRIPSYTSTASGADVYRCFVLPTGISANKFITSFEAIPANRAIVHHVLVYADTTGICAALDAADPAPGYTSFGGVGTDNAILLGGWVPGSSPVQMPPGFGVRLPASAKVVVQIHYPAGTAGMRDSTEIHFFFSPVVVRNAYILPVLNHFSNIRSPLVIPANTVKSFEEVQSIPVDLSLIGVAPHMHLLGQNIRSFAVKPNGDTLRFIDVPEWDFHWQGFYLLKQIMKVDANSIAYAQATYDNTTNNPENPNNPPKTVRAGEATTDEMMIVYFVFALYQPGDENIMIEQAEPTAVKGLKPYYGDAALLQPYPNPASGELIAKYYLAEPAEGSLALFNVAGQMVQHFGNGQRLQAGYTAQLLDVCALPTGAYFLQLRVAGRVMSQPVMIRH